MIRHPPRSPLFPYTPLSRSLETGRIVWTAYNIGPDSQVLAKPGTFKPFYDRGTELALTSWPADEWKRSEEHTSELQSPCNLVCRLLLEKKKIQTIMSNSRVP